MSASQKTLPEHNFITVRNTKKEVYLDKENEDGSKTVEKVTVFEGQQRNAPQSQRAVYLQLKKEMVKVEKAQKK